MKKIYLLFFYLLIFLSCFGQNRTLNLNLEGVGYDGLNVAFGIDGQEEYCRIRGEQLTPFNWKIVVPDSVFYNYNQVYFQGVLVDQDIKSNIVFSIIDGKDTLRSFGELGLEDLKTINISAVFDKKQLDNLHGISSDFYIIKKAPSETFLSIKSFCKGFSMFVDENRSKTTHKEYIDEYKGIINGSPNSLSLTKGVASTMSNYSIQELQEIFNLFSDKTKKTYFGEKIQAYIEKELSIIKFENSVLVEFNSDKLEKIIIDSTKYNLVVFSASWCVACHKQIPILKEIHEDLKDNLNIIYVSLDEYSTVDSWKKLIEKEEIPWRSVLAVNDVKGIIKKYNANFIPRSYLVFPNNEMRIIDVRERVEKDDLYKFVLNSD